MNNINVIAIKQIYNFIAEYPDIRSNIDKIQKFMNFYFYDRQIEINEFNNDYILKINGTDLIFNLNEIPNFVQREDFINWCISHLIH